MESFGFLLYFDGSIPSKIVHRNHTAQPALPSTTSRTLEPLHCPKRCVYIFVLATTEYHPRVHLADSEFARCYIRLYFPCFLTSSTEHFACNATVSDTLPSTILSNPRRPCDPITTRSAFHSSAEDRIA